MKKIKSHNIVSSILSLLIIPPFLGGCDWFGSKDPLPGKREAIFTNDTTIQSESSYSGPSISVPKGEVNHRWNLPGGSLSNALPPLALPTKLHKLWSTSIGSGNSPEKRLTSNVVIDHDVIYTIDTHSVVSAINLKTGDTLWSARTAPDGEDSESLGGGICTDSGRVYVTTSFGDVIALNAKDGKLLWKQALQNPYRIAPTASGGNVFAVNIANETYALDGSSGTPLWHHEGLPENTGILGGAVPAIDSGMIIVPYSSGEVYALDIQTGSPVWVETLSPSMSADSLSNISHIRARPVIYGDMVYVISYGGRLVALDLRTGTRKWQRDFAGLRTPAVYGENLYFVGTEGDLVCLDRHEGKVVWATRLQSILSDKTRVSWAGPVIAGGYLVVTGSNGDISMHALKDGKRVHVLEEGDALSLSPVVVNNKLLILSDSARLTVWG